MATIRGVEPASSACILVTMDAGRGICPSNIARQSLGNFRSFDTDVVLPAPGTPVRKTTWSRFGSEPSATARRNCADESTSAGLCTGVSERLRLSFDAPNCAKTSLKRSVETYRPPWQRSSARQARRNRSGAAWTASMTASCTASWSGCSNSFLVMNSNATTFSFNKKIGMQTGTHEVENIDIELANQQAGVADVTCPMGGRRKGEGARQRLVPLGRRGTGCACCFGVGAGPADLRECARNLPPSSFPHQRQNQNPCCYAVGDCPTMDNRI